VIVFETCASDSPNLADWSQQNTVGIDTNTVGRLFVGLNAGTYGSDAAGSPAIFTNLHRQHN